MKLSLRCILNEFRSHAGPHARHSRDSVLLTFASDLLLEHVSHVRAKPAPERRWVKGQQKAVHMATRAHNSCQRPIGHFEAPVFSDERAEATHPYGRIPPTGVWIDEQGKIFRTRTMHCLYRSDPFPYQNSVISTTWPYFC